MQRMLLVVGSSFLLLLHANVRAAAAAGADTHGLFQSAKLFYKNISSLEFSYTVQWDMAEIAVENTVRPASKLKQEFHCMYSGSDFLVKQISFSSSETNEYTYAYDGNRFQFLRRDLGILGLGRQEQQVDMPMFNICSSPILKQFLFEINEKRAVTLSDLSKDQIWMDLEERSELVGEGNINGHPTVVMRLKHPDDKVEIMMNLAKDLDFYPLKFIIKYEDSTTESCVTKHQVQMVDGIKTILPLVIETKIFLKNGKLAQAIVTNLDVKSLRFNPVFPVEQFTISGTSARIVHDVDLDQTLKRDETTGKTVIPPDAIPMKTP